MIPSTLLCTLLYDVTRLWVPTSACVNKPRRSQCSVTVTWFISPSPYCYLHLVCFHDLFIHFGYFRQCFCELSYTCAFVHMCKYFRKVILRSENAEPKVYIWKLARWWQITFWKSTLASVLGQKAKYILGPALHKYRPPPTTNRTRNRNAKSVLDKAKRALQSQPTICGKGR